MFSNQDTENFLDIWNKTWKEIELSQYKRLVLNKQFQNNLLPKQKKRRIEQLLCNQDWKHSNLIILENSTRDGPLE